MFVTAKILPEHKLATIPINVAQVRQLSPFRYPGGKTWLVPEIRRRLHCMTARPRWFIEPFVGGGNVALTVAVEGLADRVKMVELDDDVASVWQTILASNDSDLNWLCQTVLEFPMDSISVRDILVKTPQSVREQAFRTILKNRVNRGGILAPGASVIKNGENHKGLRSRWYPQTLVNRMQLIRRFRHVIQFVHGDAFTVMSQHLLDDQAVFFLDPPYTAGGKKPGSRLYVHNVIDHGRLFDLMSQMHGNFMATYDDTPEVMQLAETHRFQMTRIPMKTTHHVVTYELLVSRA